MKRGITAVAVVLFIALGCGEYTVGDEDDYIEKVKEAADETDAWASSVADLSEGQRRAGMMRVLTEGGVSRKEAERHVERAFGGSEVKTSDEVTPKIKLSEPETSSALYR